MVVLAVLVLGVLGLGITVARDARLSFTYEGPSEATAPGDSVTVRATDGECGPLVVTLHRQTMFGLWNQTHSGNIFDGFTRDERPWWSLSRGSYFTPVPCSLDGSTTFSLPEDVTANVIAACDSDGRCARISVDH